MSNRRAADLALIRRVDERHLEYPFAGSRMLRDLLNREGLPAGRRHGATPTKRMDIGAIYRRPNTLKPAPGNKIYPYLLRRLKVESLNQVWAMDISYMVVNWFSRRVLNRDQRTAFSLPGRSDFVRLRQEANSPYRSELQLHAWGQ